VRQVALTAEQVEQYDLPPAPGKATDARAARFQARHGRLVQVEWEALRPKDLQALLQADLKPLVDMSLVAAV
jgi:hypothetical protein